MANHGRPQSSSGDRSALTAAPESHDAKLARLDEGRAPTLLFVLHVSPFSRRGGTEFHVRDLLQGLALDRAVVAYPAGRELVVAEVFEGNVGEPVFYRFALRKPPDLVCIDNPEITGLVRHWIELFAISGCHIHHLSSWPITLGRALAEFHVPYLYTSHDYYAVCPNWNLFNYDLGESCECLWGPELDGGCLQAFAKEVGPISSIDPRSLRYEHRQAFLEFASGAAAIVFPSEVARRRVLQALAIELNQTRIIEHGSNTRLRVQRSMPGANLRVAAVGGVAGKRKGNRNYLDLIRRTTELPVEWHLFGADQLPGLSQKRVDPRRLRFHGAYQRDAIADLLATHGIDLCVIAPSVDETFSYVLSEVWAAGVPVVVNEKGSLPERVNRHGAGVVAKDIDQAVHWIERFARNRAELEPFAAKARATKQPSPVENAQTYLQLYRTLKLLRMDRRVPFKALHRQELAARRTVVDPGTPATEATPEYQTSRWYPRFLSFKSYIPSTVRRLGRRILVFAERTRGTRRKMVLNREQELRSLAGRRQASRRVGFQATGSTPEIIFEIRPFRPELVRTVEFELRSRSTSSHLNARLFWVHAFDEPFSIEKSMTIPLQGDGRWHRYRAPIEGELKPKWEAGAEIVRLRFDPVNEPIAFETKLLNLNNFTLAF